MPTPVSQPSGNSPEEHLGKKPGRAVVTDLSIIAEHGLFETGGRLIPTPSVADATGGHERRGGVRGDELLLKGLAKEGHLERFGPYAPVIARWEHVLGRPAPDPTEPGKTRPRLSSRFVEWLMGLDPGHVTGIGLTRNQELKALGNGVVPQQGAAALRHLDQIRRTS
ncbi:DNA-cytosine methyltransferase [Brachybacterium sp. SW0106-09]|nr:DNA-cytosine methyltransferase [Brachybacterium sp. SW0106-09]